MKRLIPAALVALMAACSLGPRDDRPPQVKAAAEKQPVATAKDDDGDAPARAAYLAKVELRGLSAHEGKAPLTNERVAIVDGEVKNVGERSVAEVQVMVYFLDAAGKRVGEQETYPVLAANPFNREGPLKPNYSRPWGGGYKVPSDWAGKVEAKVTDIKFAKDAAK
jgi:hypothetical protein